ncbi:MAG: hypothetical protein KDC24_12440 [Saprospiraceae bacterium]|nr:hypothetical protein [Saprospiraceae bacterium]
MLGFLKRNKNTKSTTRQELVEGKDFYIENGFYVMTAHFHQKRGYCCGNKCRHCPYNHENVPTTSSTS